MKRPFRLIPLLLLAWTPAALAQHGHLNAGAAGTSQGDPLLWHNGSIFATESGYVQPMPLQTEGIYAGFYSSGPSITALPQTIANGGPVPGAPALGSFIQIRFESVTGPEGALFSFWDEGETAPGISMQTGTTSPSLVWNLSDPDLGAGEPSADPFGHIHGRTFTADQPGQYTVGFRLVDGSVNGVSGGPIHDPSDVLYINFQTVPEPPPWVLGLLGLVAVGGVWAKHTLRGRRQT